MPKPTKAERRFFNEQAAATTRIEGHVPTLEFMADCAAYVDGTMTTEEMRAASVARTLVEMTETAES
jgi:hypothetical protein